MEISSKTTHNIDLFPERFGKENIYYVTDVQRRINANIPSCQHIASHSYLDFSRVYVRDDGFDNIGPSSTHAPSNYRGERKLELCEFNDESNDAELSHDSNSDSELDDYSCNVSPSNGRPYKEPVKKTQRLLTQHNSTFKSTQRKLGNESASVNKSNSESAQRALDKKQRAADEKTRKSREAAAKALQKASSKVVKTTSKILPAFSGMFRSLRLDIAGIATQRRK
jgi:hypothetical protein